MSRGASGARAAATQARRTGPGPGWSIAVDRPPDTIAPDGSEIRYLELGASRASLVEVTLPARAVSRAVRHRSVEEIWHFLRGRGQVWLRRPEGEEQVVAVGPGSSLVIPSGWAFQFAAGGGEALVFLCYTSPPWPGNAEAEPAGPGGLNPPGGR